mmetsp:Transcript_41560/g.67519  ORF Transcript_41560/g.67519 Transcript_41560/m.67519 type:complete len:107 (-) Transcript_41560:713-1033(-)
MVLHCQIHSESRKLGKMCVRTKSPIQASPHLASANASKCRLCAANSFIGMQHLTCGARVAWKPAPDMRYSAGSCPSRYHLLQLDRDVLPDVLNQILQFLQRIHTLR